MNTIHQQMREDLLYLSRLRRQIVQTEGEPETNRVFDWDRPNAKYEDESYVTPEQTAELKRQLHPGTEDDDDDAK